MKNLLTLLLTMSAFAFAQEDAEYKYEPEVNKAEYYIGTYNKGKDLEDMVKWYDKFAEWAEDHDGIYDSMTTAILQPYFHSNLNNIDVMWVNTWPTPGEQFLGLETWITKGGGDLLKSLPATNSQQIDTWQWTISQPASMKEGNMMYATYADCSLEDDYDLRQVYDLYMDFAIYAQSQGDTVGRKLIVPNSGVQLPDGVDFVRLMYSSSISERGTNADLFYSKIIDSDAATNLKGFSCTNARSYFGAAMRAPE